MNNETTTLTKEEEVVLAATRAFENFSDVIKDTLVPAFVAFGQSIDAAYKILYQNYLESGAPFGATPEGFDLWIDFCRIHSIKTY